MTEIKIDKEFFLKVVKRVDDTAKAVEELKNKSDKVQSDKVQFTHTPFKDAISVSFLDPTTEYTHRLRGALIAKELGEIVKKFNISKLEFSYESRE